MAYSKEIYKKAERKLASRRDNAEMQAEVRKEEIIHKLPEVGKIQDQLAQIGLQISELFFYKGDVQEKVAELRNESRALTDKRAVLLQNAGYAPDAMQPHYTCTACNDRGFINGRLCKCHKQLLKEIMRSEVEKTAPLDKCTFDTFDLRYYSETPMENGIVPRQKAELVSETARKYAQNFSMASKNLLFLGGAGLGKTHLSLAIANVVINKGYYVCYGTSQNICDDLQSEQFGRTDNILYTKRQVLECDLLILDDLGTEIDNQYSIATLYNIINSRILSGRPTVISTNFKFSKLEERYDKRITSRLVGEYVSLYLFGNDIRSM